MRIDVTFEHGSHCELNYSLSLLLSQRCQMLKLQRGGHEFLLSFGAFAVCALIKRPLRYHVFI